MSKECPEVGDVFVYIEYAILLYRDVDGRLSNLRLRDMRQGHLVGDELELALGNKNYVGNIATLNDRIMEHVHKSK